MKTIPTISIKDLKSFKSQTVTIATFYHIEPLALYLSIVAADMDILAYSEVINVINSRLEFIPHSLLKSMTFRNTSLSNTLMRYAVVFNPCFGTYTLYKYETL